jgi:feruloyl esterase
VTALKSIYAGPKDSYGRRLYSSWFWDAGIWDPPSAFGAGFGAWNVALPGPPGITNTAINLTLGAAAVPMIFTTAPVVTPVAGPSGQEAFIFSYDFDTDAPRIYTTAPGYPQSAMDFMTAIEFMRDGHADLTPFARHGGKMIIYDSINDGIFSAVDLVNWYNSLAEAHTDGERTGADKQSYVRLYLVPNMAHCGGGPATTRFGGNLLTGITSWVERGTAPDRIIAANTNSSSPFPSDAPFDPRVAQNFPTSGTRALCPYPRQSRYSGSGSTSDASSFVCVDPDHDQGSPGSEVAARDLE